MTTARFPAFSCLIALALAAAAAPARAHDFDKPQTRIVHFGDLDLSAPDGVKTLYARIRTAARAVCAEYESADSPYLARSFRTCVARAIRSAVVSVDRPELAAYYAEHAGHALF
jgi:UrcA family protein